MLVGFAGLIAALFAGSGRVARGVGEVVLAVFTAVALGCAATGTFAGIVVGVSECGTLFQTAVAAFLCAGAGRRTIGVGNLAALG